MYLPQSKYRNKSIISFIAAIIVILLMPLMFVKSDYEDRASAIDNAYDTLNDTYNATTDPEISAQLDMYKRQLDAAESYSNLKDRIDALQENDSRSEDAESSMETAESVLDTFMNIDPTEQDASGNLKYVTDEYIPSGDFNDAEKDAIKAMNAVNQKLLAPAKPGNVPEGDILEDFVPGVIRILLRFATLAVLVAFVVSGLFFVAAFGVEERVTKAKHMLYYTLVGFAIVSLAFAIVKAVTDIDFFGFI